jgi:hypothetical protein
VQWKEPRVRIGGVSLPKLALVGSFKWPEGDGYPIVYVEKSGIVREVTAAEREHLETPFDLDDGARPYIMHQFKRAAWWRIFRDWGFCPRHLIPKDVPIRAASASE